MASNLSQWEIDQLLRSINGDPAVEDQAPSSVAPTFPHPLRPYDLRHPNRFSKDHLRTLQEIHQQFARNLGPAVSSYLRLNVRAQLTTVEEMSLAAYASQQGAPPLQVVAGLNPLEYPISLALDVAPTLIALDRLCGGPGIGLPTGRQSITKIEQAILNPLIRLLAQILADAWSTIIPVQPAVERIYPPGAIVRLGQDNEAAAVFMVEFSVGESAGTLSVCVPFLTIQSIADQLHSKIWNVRSQGPRVATQRDHLISLLLDVPTDVSVILGSVDVPASALLHLRTGDVIQLGIPVQDEIDVAIEDYHVFRGRPGLASGKLAAKITSVCKGAAALPPMN